MAQGAISHRACHVFPAGNGCGVSRNRARNNHRDRMYPLEPAGAERVYDEGCGHDKPAEDEQRHTGPSSCAFHIGSQSRHLPGWVSISRMVVMRACPDIRCHVAATDSGVAESALTVTSGSASPSE